MILKTKDYILKTILIKEKNKEENEPYAIDW